MLAKNSLVFFSPGSSFPDFHFDDEFVKKVSAKNVFLLRRFAANRRAEDVDQAVSFALLMFMDLNLPYTKHHFRLSPLRP